MEETPKKQPGRPPLPEGAAADAQIQLRVTRARKGAYVKAAQKEGKTLAKWAFDALDKESGYSGE